MYLAHIAKISSDLFGDLWWGWHGMWWWLGDGRFNICDIIGYEKCHWWWYGWWQWWKNKDDDIATVTSAVGLIDAELSWLAPRPFLEIPPTHSFFWWLGVVGFLFSRWQKGSNMQHVQFKQLKCNSPNSTKIKTVHHNLTQLNVTHETYRTDAPDSPNVASLCDVTWFTLCKCSWHR